MQAIRQTQLLNKRELENATPPSASWHADYRDTAWLYIGGLLPELTEGDVCIIFSQYGNPTHLNLIRDKETGKSKGFGFLKYEDQRSCDLAVDNLGGGDVLGRKLRVDHTRYKVREGEDEETWRIERCEAEQEAEERRMNGNGKRGSDTETDSEEAGSRRKRPRKTLREEQELQDMLAIEDGDGVDQDPMREYLIREKREEIEQAKAREREKKDGKREHRHHHQRREGGDEEADQGERKHRHKHRHRDKDGGDRRWDGDKEQPERDHRLRGDEDERHRRRDDDREHRNEQKEERRNGDKSHRHRRSPNRDRDRDHDRHRSRREDR
jgi:RNA-binding motif protein, X-linked 2